MKLTREQYRELFNRLPKEIQEFCTSSQQSEKIFALAEKHHLHIDEAGILHDIVMDTVMGIIATKNLEKEISEALHIPLLDASTIVRDINESVFEPIKHILVDTYKHSNPFKPDTLQHLGEEDEVSEDNLDPKSLLAEIENPTEAKVRKVIHDPTSNLTVTEEAFVSQKHEEKTQAETTPINSELKQLVEKISGSIDNQKLTNIVTMGALFELVPSDKTPEDVLHKNTLPKEVVDTNEIDKIKPPATEVGETRVETDPYRETI